MDRFALTAVLLLNSPSLARGAPGCLESCNAPFWASGCGPGDLACACRAQCHLQLPCSLHESCTAGELNALKGLDEINHACTDVSGPEVNVGQRKLEYQDKAAISNVVLNPRTDTDLDPTSTFSGVLIPVPSSYFETESETTAEPSDIEETGNFRTVPPATETTGGESSTEPSTSESEPTSTEGATSFTRSSAIDPRSTFVTRTGRPTQTSDPGEDASSEQPSSEGSSTGLGIGLGVGLGLGLPLSGLVLFLFWRTKRRDKKEDSRDSSDGGNQTTETPALSEGFGKQVSPSQPSELWTPPPVFEMPGTEARVELDGEGRR